MTWEYPPVVYGGLGHLLGDLATAQARASVFIPALLLALAVVAWFAFQTVQLWREQQQLELMKTSLAPQEQAAAKLRASLDEVATSTAKLAAGGNANARVIVEQLRNRGVTINAAAAKQ